MSVRLAVLASCCWLVLALPAPAMAVPDYDGDGFIAGDCLPLDPAAHPGATDEPDLALEDLDCDGIDGTAAAAFFVATTGSDAGLGSKEAPFGTIAFAVAQAAAAIPKRDVYVQEGTYAERVVLAGGVSIYGGYLPGGARATGAITTIQGPAGQAEAVFADAVTGVELQLLSITGPSVAAAGASSYAIRAIGGSALALTGVTATGGSAGDGSGGGPGNVGTGAANGRCGGFDQQLGCSATTFGGAGSLGAGGTGSNGGAGANSAQNSNGTTGSPGLGSAPGAGGAGGQPFLGNCSSDPSDAAYCGGRGGGSGGKGADGNPGTGAAFGIAGAGAGWLNPAAANVGTAASPGSGGGGGGSGKSLSSGCFSGAGGGGGGAGTGGTAGTGGANGGGSFAVYLSASSVVVDGGNLAGGPGGDGGSGGAGGLGGSGGGGGGGASAPAGCFAGGSGGKGGDGGRGGGGGGGAGGPSVGVFATSTANFAVRPNAAVAGGTGGAAGAPGAGGAAGPSNSGGAGSSAGTLAQPGANASAKDFDGDGKADADDVCPAVPAPTGDGCPARPAKLADGDGDGVPDAVDACPAQAGGPTDADVDGCPGGGVIDSDRDGFPNTLDCNDSDPNVNPSAPEIAGNAIDEDCDGVAAPFPRITSTVSTRGFSTRSATTFQRLLIREVPAGGSVRLRCSGKRRACPFGSKKLAVSKRGTADGLKVLSRRARRRGLVVGVGATLEIRITAPGQVGKVVRYKIVKLKFPKGVLLCLPPGASRPRACT